MASWLLPDFHTLNLEMLTISVWPTKPFGPRPPPGRKKNILKGTASNGYEAKFEHSY